MGTRLASLLARDGKWGRREPLLLIHDLLEPYSVVQPLPAMERAHHASPVFPML